MKHLIIIAFSIILAACGATGVKITDSQIANLKKGQTTIDQATAQLGQPTNRMTLSDFTTLTYSYGEYSARAASFIPVVGVFAGGADVRSSMVMLKFDKQGILQDIITSQSQYGAGNGVSAGNIDTTKVDQPKQ
jgi:outer membrane protein assembly factor BamE (lipoprotein component of BamABCDE complex)